MKKNKLKRALLIIPILFVLLFWYTISMQKKMARIRLEVGSQINTTKEFLLQVIDAAGKKKWFRLGEPKSVSREVFFRPETRSSNAFHLSLITSHTVDGLTHLETSAHILDPDTNPPYVKDIPLTTLSGIVYLIDLSHIVNETGQTGSDKVGYMLRWEAIRSKLEQNTLPISMLALKTRASLLPQDYDFSGKYFLSLAPETAKGIHDYVFKGNSSEKNPSRIGCLILDIPSIDPEKDGDKLLAHRNFFGLPSTGYKTVDREKRALVELAWFSDLIEGYYYAYITPPRFQANAVSTGIIFRQLIEIEVEKK